MIKGVIFDADGVLLDSLLIWKNLGRNYLEKYNVKPKPGLDKELFSMSMEQGAFYLKNEYSLSIGEEDIFDGLRGMLSDFYYYEVKLKAGVQELLEFLRGKDIKMSVATSSPKLLVNKALERNGIISYFSDILTTSEVGESKHSSLIFIKSAEILGLKPEEIMVFEDSLYALKTAIEAGFLGIGVYDEYGEPKQRELKLLSHFYLEKLENFKTLVRALQSCGEFHT